MQVLSTLQSTAKARYEAKVGDLAKKLVEMHDREIQLKTQLSNAAAKLSSSTVAMHQQQGQPGRLEQRDPLVARTMSAQQVEYDAPPSVKRARQSDKAVDNNADATVHRQVNQSLLSWRHHYIYVVRFRTLALRF